MGVTMIIDNRPGANGGIGTDIVTKSPPDGYTLLLDSSGPIVVNPSLYTKVPYDPVKDLAPISQYNTYQYVLVVPTASRFKSVADIVAAAKADPGALSYGSSGIGGGAHLAGEMLSLLTGAKMTHVPYKGNAPALADLLAGQLSFTFDTIITSVPQLKGGKLRAFAVSGPTRSSSLPQVPTMAEAGFKGFNITQFQGLLAPAGTPPAIIDRLYQESVKALKLPDVVTKLVTDGGTEIVGGTPAEFARQIQSDLALYSKLIKDAHVRAD
jgi:tripartite-type tricarboxylate transporter receptor subunit TctC